MPGTEASTGSSSRRTAAQIFADAVEVGEEELKRSSPGLAFSGFAAGLGMGLSGLGSAAVLVVAGHGEKAALLAALLYPLGFIAVIVGRAQLFTENTLFPVILVLDRRRHVLNTLRLWVVVFAANLLGALLFAALMVVVDTLTPSLRHSLEHLGTQAAAGSWSSLFWKGIAGGWIIALVAWLVTASRDTSAQVVLIWLATFVIGAAHLAHCIAGSTEILAGVLGGHVAVGTFFYWLSAATLGNALGGVVMVSLLNYGQVVGSGRDTELAHRSLEEAERDRPRFRGRQTRAA
jgi:formate/nitrite transporter FocA (FNT family)